MRTDMPPRHPTVYITQTGQESPSALPQLLHMEAHQNSLLYPLLRTHAHLYHSTPRCFLARTFIGQESQHKCIKTTANVRCFHTAALLFCSAKQAQAQTHY